MSIIPSAAPNNTSPAPLSPEREAEIRTDLDAIPAPPWRWIGSRHAGGPQLVTDHSGRQYLLRAAKPTDHRGDELLDPETYSVVYGDLEFRDQREGEKYSTMRSGDALAIGRTEYDPDAIVSVANPVARWIEASAQYATDLLTELDRVRAELAARPSRAEVLRQEGDAIVKHCPDHSPQDQDGVWMDCHCDVADEMRRRANKTATGGAS